MREAGTLPRGILAAALTLASASVLAHAQDASRGMAMPFTVTGGSLVSERAKAEDPNAASVTAGFRAILYPGFKVNSRWYGLSAIQVRSAPFYYYDAFYPEKEIELEVQQLFLGYRWTGEESAFGFKVGKLPSAFGSFPLRYSDSINPLLDQPFAYAYAVKLRPDQRPCGTADLDHQKTYPVYVHHYCGGATMVRNGMVPVTLYGLPGAELHGSWHKVDGRFQLTNSSPANPQDLRSNSQNLQWTAGAGYTLWQGFRIGASGFRGPFLEEAVSPLLDPGTDVRDYPAVGIGGDMQWGRGRWSANAEWQRVRFHYPRFRTVPAISSGYAELKATLNPRFYTALRIGYETYGRVEDDAGIESGHFFPNRRSHEFAVGYHVNHFQTLKLGYEWLKTNGVSGTRDNVFGVQFVTSVNSLSKSY
jgi:hypothetical protein